ncbi:hypothetical protein [Chlorogloea sp. CCALA 695]|nr:hypothetical protein [Chlorogloea sp. CCALA 695]
MRSPIISFLLLLSLIMPLSACNFGGGESEEGSENTEQKKEDDDDDD